MTRFRDLPDPKPDPACGAAHPAFTVLRCDLAAGHDGEHHPVFQNVIARGEPRRTVHRGKR